MAKDTVRNTYTLENEETGEVRIADEVVATVAGLAATEVDGVRSIGGGITEDMVGKVGMKNLQKGVRINVENGTVSVGLTLNLDFGTSIPEVCQAVQEKVKSAIENMTGFSVTEVNIQVDSMDVE